MSELALLGGKKSKSKPFPTWPYFDDTERRGLTEVLESGVWWRTPGTKTLEFEGAFARFHGARHGLAVTNGTAALEVAMAALGLQPGDEVIVPNFTFVATASAVLFANALPVLVDVRPDTYCLDPELTEAAITPNTKAIIAVHMGGHPAEPGRLERTRGQERHCAGRRLRPRACQRMARETCRNLRHRRHFQFSIQQVDDCRRRWHGHLQRRRIRARGPLRPRLRPSAGRMVLQPLQLRIELSPQRMARRDSNGAVGTSGRDKLGAVIRMPAWLDKELSQIPGITPQKLDERCTRNGQYAYIFHVDSKQFAGISTRELHRRHECRRHSQSGQLSAAARTRHVSQRSVPQATERTASHG